jgi:hypothetical protein
MVVLRPTRKLQRFLPLTGDGNVASDTALGDWYVNRVVIDRQPLLLLVSSSSLLSILVPARDVRSLPERLAGLVGARLERMGVSACVVAAEADAMSPVQIGKTTDRSVLGIMVDFAKGIPFYLEVGGWDETTLPFVESRLAETPCYAARRFEDMIIPDKKAPELLARRWHAG